jgi:ribosome biogenesis GTPase
VTGRSDRFQSDYDYELEQDERYRERRGRKPVAKRSSGDLIPGIVIRARGHHFDVRTDGAGETDGRAHNRLCEVRGRMLQQKETTTRVAVGDRVQVKPEGAGKGLIEQVEARVRVLSRQLPGTETPFEDVMLANPDQVLVVFAVAKPEPHLRMLDRYLVVAEANGLPVIICANKVDLTGIAAARQMFALYEQLGYPVIYASVKQPQGLDELRRLLRGKTTVLSGPSGVGKSSLLNALAPALQLPVGALRDFMDKGAHTTRGAQLFHLPLDIADGEDAATGAPTFVADTPGIRELGLFDIALENLPFYFREMAPLLHDCRFPGCSHDHEPGCAIRAAVEKGAIAGERYASYLKLLKGEEG